MTDQNKRPGGSRGATSPNHDDHPNQASTAEQANKQSAASDPFDPAAFRLSQDFGVDGGVKKVLLKIPVRKPQRQEFIRVHADPAFAYEVALVELKDEREVYLVVRELQTELSAEVKAARLYPTINRQGILSLWPCWLPGPDGKTNPWHETAIQAAELAKTAWIRVVSDMSLGGYQPYQATGNLPEPDWPESCFGDLLKLAFGDRVIDRPDHPVIQRLLGQV
jgi:hypothetical protein